MRTPIPILLLLAACEGTTKIPAAPSKVRVDAEITQTASGAAPETAGLRVALTDADGTLIENDSLQVLVNGVRIPLMPRARSAYDTRSGYLLEDDPRLRIHADSAYRVTVVWRDGKRYPAGTIRTPKLFRPVDLPETYAGGAVTLRWRGLAEPAQLVAYRGYRTRDSAGVHVTAGGPFGDDVLRRKVVGSGSLELPASYFAPGPKGTVAGLEVELTVAREAAVPRPFGGGSLRAERKMLMSMKFPEDR